MNDQKPAQTTGPIRSIMVIDDHPLYSDALVTTLEHVFEPTTIRTATTLGAGLDMLSSRFAPDLVMLDLKLPDVSGISGFLKLRRQVPDVPVLVISALVSVDVIHALMEAGAAGFIPKDVSAKELQSALFEVRDGRKYLPPGFEKTETPAREPSARQIANKIVDLTPQQTRIMKLICAGKPNKQIAYELSLAEATVKAHITALLRRLGVQNRTQAAVLVESANLEYAADITDADARAFLSQ